MLKQYGYTEDTKPENGLLPARVTAVHRERYELAGEDGSLFGKLKTSVYHGAEDEIFPTAGDFVLFTPVEGGDCQIVETLPRRSYFARSDPDPNGGRQQAVAANFDTVFIMTSLNRDFSVNRVQRYLVLARQSGAMPVVVLTKADLTEDFTEQAAAARAIAGDAEVIPVSALSGMGLDRLGTYLAPGRTVVFLGMSGVGKSSLLNAVTGRDVMAVNAIREDDSRGRHTTTHRQLVMLPNGAMVIDTPGMRTLGMWNADEGLSETFADVEELFGSCRFSDCRHENEPGCAVKEAVRQGMITAERLDNYDKLRRESAYAEKKAYYLQIKRERDKNIALFGKRQKKNGGIRF